MQTKLTSLTEAILGTASGFLVAMVVWQGVIAPLWGYEVTILDNIGMTTIFTIVSIARVYLWRRLFNWLERRKFIVREHD